MNSLRRRVLIGRVSKSAQKSFSKGKEYMGVQAKLASRAASNGYANIVEDLRETKSRFEEEKRKFEEKGASKEKTNEMVRRFKKRIHFLEQLKSISVGIKHASLEMKAKK